MLPILPLVTQCQQLCRHRLPNAAHFHCRQGSCIHFLSLLNLSVIMALSLSVVLCLCLFLSFSCIPALRRPFAPCPLKIFCVRCDFCCIHYSQSMQQVILPQLNPTSVTRLGRMQACSFFGVGRLSKSQHDSIPSCQSTHNRLIFSSLINGHLIQQWQLVNFPFG